MKMLAKLEEASDKMEDVNITGLRELEYTIRQEYLDWGDFFMATAFLASKRSKDPRCQVGACIVDEENRILGVGYNGMPNGFKDDFSPWGPERLSYVCHAELNAIGLCKADVTGCTMYVTRFPCNDCAKLIIQSGIKKVFYLFEKKSLREGEPPGERMDCMISRTMLRTAHVAYWQYKPKSQSPITIDMTEIPPWVNGD